MKILHVLHAYPPSMGGVQLLFQNISERLVADFGAQVTVYTTTAYRNTLFWNPTQPAMPAEEQTLAGVRVRRFPVWNHLPQLRLNLARVAHKVRLPGEDWLRSLYFGPIVPGLAQAIVAADVDIIVASAFPLYHMHVAVRAAKRHRAPLVLLGALHPLDQWCFERPNIYQAIRQADAYIALSKFERDHILARNAAPQDAVSRVHVIGGGVDAARFGNVAQPELSSMKAPCPRRRTAGGTPPVEHFNGRIPTSERRATYRQQWGWGTDDPAIIFLGRHAEHKQIATLIATMQLVWGQVLDARLLIAGARTDYTPTLERQVAALPYAQQSQITWLMDFEETEKPGILAACDILVNLSAYESFGLVFLEAWAAGLPVIGVREGAIPTIIAEGQDGLLATYGDVSSWSQALLKLINRPDLRQKMGRAGQKKVHTQYDWPIITQRFYDTYARAIGNTYG